MIPLFDRVTPVANHEDEVERGSPLSYRLDDPVARRVPCRPFRAATSRIREAAENGATRSGPSSR
jgi:hypothetical protein